MVWEMAVGALAGVLALYVGLLILLWRAWPAVDGMPEAVRLPPDVLRLVARLARDTTLPRGLRVRLWLLVAYLALPVDVVPDFIPVIGYADDVVLVAWTLRSVVRCAGTEAVVRRWPGTPQGLRSVVRLAAL